MRDEVSEKRHGTFARPVEHLRTEHVVVTEEEGGRVLRFRRTTQPFATVADAKRMYGQVLAVYDRLGRAERGLLVDSRDAPGRNDPEFEAALLEFRSQALPGFAAIAILMKTAVGKLQAQRYEGKTTESQFVTDDEASALEHLLTWAKGPAKGAAKSAAKGLPKV